MPMQSLVSLWGQGNLAQKVVMLGTPDSKLLNLRAWPCNIMSGIVVFNYMALTL